MGFIVRNNGVGTADVKLTNEAGLSDHGSVSITAVRPPPPRPRRRRRRSGDPLIFDLNRDEKVDIIGGEKAFRWCFHACGFGEISIKAGANSENRYVVNNANQGNGAHSTEDSVIVFVHATLPMGIGRKRKWRRLGFA